MDLKIHQTDKNVIISGFETDFSFDNAPVFITEIKKIFFDQNCDIILDFSTVSYIDSSGVGQVIHLSKYLNEHSHRIMIVNACESVFRVLKMFKLDNLFSFSQDDSLIETTAQGSENTYFLIGAELSDKKKQKIREILAKEVVFYNFSGVNTEYLFNFVKQKSADESADYKEKLFSIHDENNAVSLCKELADKKIFKPIHDAIVSHPNPEIRRTIVLQSLHMRNDASIMSVLKKALFTEKNSQVQKSIAYAIEELRKRNLKIGE